MPDDYGRWLLHGPQGAGKSTLASTIAELGKTLFIDLNGEKGIRSFKGSPYSENLKIARPTSITALDDIFWQLNAGNHDFKCVVIDSLTGFQKMTMRYQLHAMPSHCVSSRVAVSSISLSPYFRVVSARLMIPKRCSGPGPTK